MLLETIPAPTVYYYKCSSPFSSEYYLSLERSGKSLMQLTTRKRKRRLLSEWRIWFTSFTWKLKQVDKGIKPTTIEQSPSAYLRSFVRCCCSCCHCHREVIAVGFVVEEQVADSSV